MGRHTLLGWAHRVSPFRSVRPQMGLLSAGRGRRCSCAAPPCSVDDGPYSDGNGGPTSRYFPLQRRGEALHWRPRRAFI
jgi:hypothetical protein